MITIIVSIYLFIGLLFTSWFLMTGLCQEGVGEQYVEWYSEIGTPLVILVSVILGTGLGLFWPIISCVLLWIRYH